jgi:predicted amidohydrolase YtcJ
MIWDGIQKPFLGTLTCTSRITSITPGAPLSLPSDCQLLDAKGGSVIPAFTDVHQHFSASSHKNSSKFVLLQNAQSLSEAINLLLRSEIAKLGDWIVGFSLNHNQFPDPKLPTGSDFDVIPNPVLISHQCGHTYFINSLAISKVGASNFANLDGVHRDSKGRMTGVLDDGADAPLRPFFTNFHDDCPDDWIRCMKETLSFGIAEVHAISADVVLAGEAVHIYEKLRNEGKLGLRVRLYLTEIEDGRNLKEDEWLSYGGHKIFVDGAFGGRTAAMKKPFIDVNTTGILRYTDEELYEDIRHTFVSGVQLMVHVIGDRGMDQILNMLERLNSEGIRSGCPIKLTHCELCYPDQIRRIAKLDAFCDVQPNQIISEGSFLPNAIGSERMKHCFPFRSMIDEGVTIVGSSDAPVDPDNPLIGIHGAVIRHPEMNLEERITLNEALKMSTINAQKLIKNDHNKGLLKSGYVADITVFKEDLFAVEPENLLNCKVAATIVNGKIAYQRYDM